MIVVSMRAIHLDEVEDLRLNFRSTIDRLVLEGKWKPIEDRTYSFSHVDESGQVQSQSNYYMFIYQKII